MKMKNKFLFLAALVSGIALVSCEQREFVPKTANNPVQFPAELDTIGMTSEYVYIPVQMTDQFTTRHTQVAVRLNLKSSLIIMRKVETY